MRPDMHHLLVERGHAGTGYTRYQPKGWAAQTRFRNDEDTAEESWIEPRRRPHFSENLAPLYRYLRKQVGRPWDKVYSEIRTFVNADTAVQFHILQHLYDRLAVTVWEDAQGNLWNKGRGRGPERLDQRWYRQMLYVCPRTGLIRRVPEPRHQQPKSMPLDCLPASGPDHEYRQLGGQWYEVWWGMVQQNTTWVRAIVRKRQLGYKELRNLGLRD